MKRNYLTVPGQSVTITIDGPSGSGKPGIRDHLADHFQAQGLFAAGDEIQGRSVVVVTCPTSSEARDIYLETLGEHEIATLRGHLDALGYEL